MCGANAAFLCQYPIANDRMPGGSKRADKRGPNADEITLTPLELIDSIYKVFPPLWGDCGALTGGPSSLRDGSVNGNWLESFGFKMSVP